MDRTPTGRSCKQGAHDEGVDLSVQEVLQGIPREHHRFTPRLLEQSLHVGFVTRSR